MVEVYVLVGVISVAVGVKAVLDEVVGEGCNVEVWVKIGVDVGLKDTSNPKSAR